MRFEKLKYILLSIIGLLTILIIYIKSFEKIEQVCVNNSKSTEYYLINYITKKDLKSSILLHNKDSLSINQELERVYLLNNILEIHDPLFYGSKFGKINYRKQGCKEIDILDIFCQVRFLKLENGKIKSSYNFIGE